MLFIYRYLNISNYQSLVEEIKSNIDLHKIRVEGKTFTQLSISELRKNCKHLREYLDQNNLNVIKAIIIKSMPGDGKDKIHIDNCDSRTHQDLKLNYVYKCENTRDILGLQIGLENILNTYTGFFKYVSGEIIELNHINTNNPSIKNFPSLNFKNAEMIEIDRYTADRPVLFNATVPHTVFNPTDKPRLLLSLRFDPDPWHMTRN